MWSLEKKSDHELDLDATMPNVELVSKFNHSCRLSTATIEYSCMSVCVSVCVQDNSKNNGSIH